MGVKTPTGAVGCYVTVCAPVCSVLIESLALALAGAVAIEGETKRRRRGTGS